MTLSTDDKTHQISFQNIFELVNEIISEIFTNDRFFWCTFREVQSQRQVKVLRQVKVRRPPVHHTPLRGEGSVQREELSPKEQKFSSAGSDPLAQAEQAGGDTVLVPVPPGENGEPVCSRAAPAKRTQQQQWVLAKVFARWKLGEG